LSVQPCQQFLVAPSVHAPSYPPSSSSSSSSSFRSRSSALTALAHEASAGGGHESPRAIVFCCCFRDPPSVERRRPRQAPTGRRSKEGPARRGTPGREGAFPRGLPMQARAPRGTLPARFACFSVECFSRDVAAAILPRRQGRGEAAARQGPAGPCLATPWWPRAGRRSAAATPLAGYYGSRKRRPGPRQRLPLPQASP